MWTPIGDFSGGTICHSANDVDELPCGVFLGGLSCHTARDDDVTPYADTATRDNKSEVATSLLAPVSTAAMLVTCPYDTRANFCASAPVVACAAAIAAETGGPDEACPPGMPAKCCLHALGTQTQLFSRFGVMFALALCAV